MELSENERETFLAMQKNEITSSVTYKRLASIDKNTENCDTFLKISGQEMGHYATLQRYTGKTVQANHSQVNRTILIARIFGVTFAVKLLEKDENKAYNDYSKFAKFPDVQRIETDERQHEVQLIGMINEERLEYMGSVVLGLNDALVEFTGALAGFTLALSNAPLIALTGSITGIAAALSMASSEYLSTKSENDSSKHPIKASIYTGIAYLVTVITLVLPFILLSNVLIALAVMFALAIAIIAIFNYYYSVAKSEPFKRRFLEMAILSMSVAGVSFLIGYLLKLFTGIEA